MASFEFGGAIAGLISGGLVGIISVVGPVEPGYLKSSRLSVPRIVFTLGVVIAFFVCFQLWMQGSISPTLFLPLVNGLVGASVAYFFVTGLLLLKKYRKNRKLEGN